MNSAYQNRRSHPYEDVLNEIASLKKIVLQIKNAPKEDYNIKYYTRQEAADILKRSKQSIDNYIKKGWIVIEHSGPRGKLIHHYQIFNEDQSLKDFYYKRNA